MTLPRFHSRISNALGPLGGSTGELMTRLSTTDVSLEMGEGADEQPVQVVGFLFAVNLCARLYPRLHICAPAKIRDESVALALEINPACEIERSKGSGSALLWGTGTPTDSVVTVSADGWQARLDQTNSHAMTSPNALSALAAGALGVGELFRSVFKDFLPSGRRGPQPAVLNLVTLDDSNKELPELPSTIDIETLHLAGAGAVGQAALFALRQLPILGRLVVVDPESIEVSNLQRYVLAMDGDVGMSKCAVAQRTFQGTNVDVVAVETVWGNDEHSATGVKTVAVALDTSAARIGIQAGLPWAIYNAWTQPADLGWSRHERFGEEPCLACLYTPSGLRPSQHELIARALHQPELRVLAYLTLRLAVDVPLKPEQIPRVPIYPIPPSASTWLERSILEDLVANLGIDPAAARNWQGKPISDFYREGVCGGALISDRIGELPQEVAVPLAHQSALAGIMLAAQVVCARIQELRSLRPASIEGRLDVLSGLPQVVGRPRQRTEGCICVDPDYVRRYREKWSGSKDAISLRRNATIP